MFRSFLLVGIGGAFGSMSRYGVSFIVTRYLHHQPEFPIGTFFINVVGSFIIGILFGLSAHNQWMKDWGVFLLSSGFCGGFTTFSTFALENVSLMQKGQSMIALTYTALSIVLGLLLCRVGIWLVE